MDRMLCFSVTPVLFVPIFLSLLFTACLVGVQDRASHEIQNQRHLGGSVESWGADDLNKVSTGTNFAPDFQIEIYGNGNPYTGQTIKLSQFGGRPVVLNFWYPSCPPCRLEMPDIEAAFQKHKVEGVQFIGVQNLGLDSAEEGQEFIKEFGISYPVGPDSDGSIAKAYGIKGFPTTVFIGRDSTIIQSWSGSIKADKLEAFVQKLLQ